MDLDGTVAMYCAAWDERDLARRRSLLAATITEDAVYVDPTVEIQGIDALVEHISQVAETYPGSRLEVLTGVDEHHGLARFAWRKVLEDGTTLPESLDLVEITEDGKFSRIIGFFGEPPTG